jgi:hypothetical protein
MSSEEDGARAGAAGSPATIDEALAAAIEIASDRGGRLRASSHLQSWPGMVHGGGVVALLDAAAVALGGARGSRVLEGRLTASVPTETALTLEGYSDAEGTRLAILRDGQTLGSGATSPIEPTTVATPELGGGSSSADHSPPWPHWSHDGWSLPASEHCLACGADNRLGLQARLRFDPTGVWALLPPQPSWLTPEGRWHAALAPVLLDEISWWLGALVAKEGGLTNRLRVTLHQGEAGFTGPLVGAGRFDAVTPVDRRRTFWRTESAVWARDGAVVATAAVVFRGGAEYSARQMEYFRARTPPPVFGRMFPNYAR